MAEITLDSLTKVYSDGTKAVTDMDLDVAAGEFVVFVGPSGCGKTTALRMIAGLEGITSGNVRIDGEVVNDLPPKDRDIAMVFQNYALYPHMNAAKNMGFALKMRGVSKDEIDRRVREAARILGLTDSLHKKPRTLSGGQRQRVAMGRAIVRNPQAFLMDEPLSNLDAKLRVEMRAEIARIQRDLGVTTIYVTHDQTEAMTMGDRVAVMRNGILQQVAAPKVLYDRPRNLFVAEFIGSPAMNLVLGESSTQTATNWVSFGGQRLRLEPATIERHPGPLRVRRPTGGRRDPARGHGGRRRCCGRRIPIASSPSSATFARTWAPRCTSTSTSQRSPSRPRKSSKRSWSRTQRTRRRGSQRNVRGAGGRLRRETGAGIGARAGAARARGRRHAPPLLRSRHGHRGRRLARIGLGTRP